MAIASSPQRSSDKTNPQASRRPKGTSASSSTLASIRSALDTPLASFYLVVASAGLLIGVGIMMVLSASSVFAYMQKDGDAYYFVKRQVIFCIVGTIAAVIIARWKISSLRKLALPALLLSFVLLILTYTPLGVTSGGNQNWLRLGPQFLTIQPSEFAKLAMIMWGAHILAFNRKRLDQPRYLLVPFLPVVGLLILLVVFQGDMGTAVILIGILAGMLWTVGTPLQILAAMGGAGLLGIAALTLTSSNRMARLMAFLDPTSDTAGTNMQATVGVYALASGGWWGVGLGESRQKWGSLPEAHTDFIFAVIGEELGLVGSLVVLGLIATLGYAGFRIAARSDSLFCRITAAGITFWFTFQSLVNLAVVLRLLPVMGVPLPMVSYGGSALLANLLALGVLAACARNEPAARKALAQRKRKHQPKMTTVVGTRRGA